MFGGDVAHVAVELAVVNGGSANCSEVSWYTRGRDQMNVHRRVDGRDYCSVCYNPSFAAVAGARRRMTDMTANAIGADCGGTSSHRCPSLEDSAAARRRGCWIAGMADTFATADRCLQNYSRTRSAHHHVC